ncbi:MAG: HAD-IA family hydrolase [Planctomycetota bacterium]|jgi:putative hydrolase of the HAD superfamily|nr:HAD-IA family hydrolase [Planctomycetota bacterium]
MEPAIDTIIFDLGRVLIRITPEGEKFSALMRSLGVAPEAAFGLFWRESAVERHMRGLIDSREFYRLVGNRLASALSYDDFVDAWCDIFQPNPEMESLFGKLADRFPLGLLSDTDPLHWQRVRELSPWLARVKRPTLSFETGFLKPEYGAFRRAAADCGRERLDSCLFIDDMPGNVEGARAAGMRALRFTGARELELDLERLGLLG